jgi:hypothetical protein
VAQRLGRRWIACDINKGAVQTTAKRLQAVVLDQITASLKNGDQAVLPGAGAAGGAASSPAAQVSLDVYRVNDYDLQIQHNEAVSLACEHIGITRTHNDSFFDGTLGRKLAKIVPFGHAVGPLDLEEVKRELAARPDEDRDVVVVALGKQVAADRWLEDWNRLRTRGDVPNRIDVIELRTDARYGHFFAHQPAQARVSVKRTDKGIHVEIVDFISPTILERLKEQSGLLSPQITDWRSMVDTVMIDSAYDGEVFRVAFSDVPERKNDLVAGTYDLASPSGPTTVAVKITDMLGEEVLVVQSV